MWKVVGVLLAAGAVMLFLVELPDIKRYLRISSM
jgi:hypothetical protein